MTVRQIREAEKIGAEHHDEVGNSHLCAAIMPDKIPWVCEQIRGNCHITTTDELFYTIYTSKGSVITVTEELDYSNFSACWVP